MRRLFSKMPIMSGLLCLLFVCGLQPSRARGGQSLPLKVRVGSYNIHHGEGLDKVLDVKRIGDVLRAMDADVIAIQELDSATRRIYGRDELGELSNQLMYYPSFSPSISFQGGKYGVGILSREQPLDVRRVPLPGKEESRSLLVVELPNYVFACTHLSLTQADRIASVEIIEQIAASYRKPFLIAGDWNDHPKSTFLKRMRKSFQICNRENEATFPANKPETCIDYIAVYKGTRSGLETRVGSDKSDLAAYRPFVNEAATVLSSRVIDEKVASDHAPLFVEMVLPTPSSQLLTTKPYLQEMTATSVKVMFQTNAICHAWIEYGVDSLHTTRARAVLNGQEVCDDIENQILLSDLKPGQRYFYRVCVVEQLMKQAYENHFGDSLRTRFYSFRTPEDTKEDFTCLVFNDIHDQQTCYETLRELVKGIDYDFVVFNGDCLPEPENRAHAIRMIHSLADPINGAEHPILFIRGNHEIRNFYSCGMLSLLGNIQGKTYGAFSWGDTRFVVLDCGEDKPDTSSVYAGLNDFSKLRSEQVDFLKSELNGRSFKKAKRRVLLSHIPVFGNCDSYNPCHEQWGALLKKAPFDIEVSGHTHEYAFYPQGTDGCSFPVVIGGGPTVERATAVVLSKHGKEFRVRVLSRDSKAALDQKF